MIKTLVKHGNSYALVIDKPILELLNITPDIPLEISTSDGKTLTIAPTRQASNLDEHPRVLNSSLVDLSTHYKKAVEHQVR